MKWTRNDWIVVLAAASLASQAWAGAPTSVDDDELTPITPIKKRPATAKKKPTYETGPKPGLLPRKETQKIEVIRPSTGNVQRIITLHVGSGSSSTRTTTTNGKVTEAAKYTWKETHALRIFNVEYLYSNGTSDPRTLVLTLEDKTQVEVHFPAAVGLAGRSSQDAAKTLKAFLEEYPHPGNSTYSGALHFFVRSLENVFAQDLTATRVVTSTLDEQRNEAAARKGIDLISFADMLHEGKPPLLASTAVSLAPVSESPSVPAAATQAPMTSEVPDAGTDAPQGLEAADAGTAGTIDAGATRVLDSDAGVDFDALFGPTQ